jgi:5-methylcytosine-specific restriction endonuclease McrA
MTLFWERIMAKAKNTDVRNRRLCRKCLKKKPPEQFTAQAGKLKNTCKECSRAYHRELNKTRYSSPEARQAELARGKAKYASLIKPNRSAKKAALVHMLGGKCAECGYSRSLRALDFHHVNPTEKSRTISHLLAANTVESFLLAIEEAKKCILLCSNCHRVETFGEEEVDGNLVQHWLSLAAKTHQRQLF